MSMYRQQISDIRAALVQDLEAARSSREHNDANVLVLSGAKTDESVTEAILETWLATPFGGGRHQRRVKKIAQIERDLGTEINHKTKD